MTYEKSCGAVVFYNERDKRGKVKKRYVLMIKHAHGGNYSFPKGHVEAGETEIMTAEREVFEETSVRIRINERFRQPVYYKPRPSVKKEVVYFLAFTRQTEIKPCPGEVAEVEWVPVEEAKGHLVHDNDKHVFDLAIQHIESRFKPA